MKSANSPPSPGLSGQAMVRVQGVPIRQIGGLFVIFAGLWHVAAPWLLSFSELPGATISGIVSGAMLAILGVIRIASREADWSILGIGLVGIYVLVAPGLLGFAYWGLVLNEALWTAFPVLGLAACMGLSWRFAARPVDVG